jgi:YVTN family beta-propeller protein
MLASLARRVLARPRSVITGSAIVVVAICGIATTAALGASPFGIDISAMNPFGTSEVGQTVNGRILVADNQWLSPYGQRIDVPDQAGSSALSPDGTHLAVATGGSSGASLNIIDLTTGNTVQSVSASAVGVPIYSSDGSTLYVPESTQIVKYSVASGGTVSDPVDIPIPNGAHGAAIPVGLALSPDGTTLYAALSGSNALGVIDTTTDTVVDQIPVGNAPQDVAVVGGSAYVTNRGGRVAVPGDTTNLSDGTPIVSSPVTGASTTGTVSVVNLSSNAVSGTINVGLQPSSVAADGTTLFVTNTNSDTVSIIDSTTNTVTQTFNVEPLPGSTVGASPNWVAMPDPGHLLVSVGRDNAIAVYGYNGPVSPVQYEGLIPTDWYPDQVQYDAALKKVIVTNDHGIGSQRDQVTINPGSGTPNATGYQTYQFTGTVTSFSMPSQQELGPLTREVFSDNGWDHLSAKQKPLPSTTVDGKLPAIPAELGQPSAIKHVFLIIKENRTYDQVLGDIGKGNSDPADAQFGESITPNQHALADQFTLFDNFYDDGTLSADGHNWLLQADPDDYLQWQSDTWDRSYPYNGGDALAYQRDGFIWNAAELAHKTVANYGEYEAFSDGPTPTPTWSQWYEDSQVLEGKESGTLDVPLNAYKFYSDVPSLNQISNSEYPYFDLDVPDQYRVDIWHRDFEQAEKTGKLPDLTIMQLPDDHTAGSPDPTPTAEVADNDLAVGRIVDDISHSKFWKSSAVFVLEDDTQAGVDHVDGHRGPLWIASPYADRDTINDDYYTQINVVKTIEQILGIQPMNQEDRAAIPMYSAFTNTPNLAPYNVVPNQIPLTEGLPSTTTTSVAAADRVGVKSAPKAERSVVEAWDRWTVEQHSHLAGLHAVADSVNVPQMNRYDWYTAHDWKKPYPGDGKILAPDQVPGRSLPAGYLGDG